MKIFFKILLTLIFILHIIKSQKELEDSYIEYNDIILNYPINITLYSNISILETSYIIFNDTFKENTNLLISIQNQNLDSCDFFIYEDNIFYNADNDTFFKYTTNLTIDYSVKDINIKIEKEKKYYFVFQNKTENNIFTVYFYDLNENIPLFYDNKIIYPFCLSISDFDFKNITFYLPKELNNYNKILIQYKINDTNVNGSIFINENPAINNFNYYSNYLDINNDIELKIVYGKTNNIDKYISTEICFNFLNNIYYKISEIKTEYKFNYITSGVYYFYSNLTHAIFYNKNTSFIIHSRNQIDLNDFNLSYKFASEDDIYNNDISNINNEAKIIKENNNFHIFFNINDNNNNKNIIFKLEIKNDSDNTLTFIKSGFIENLDLKDDVSIHFNTTGNLVPKIFVLNLEEIFNNNKDLIIFNNHPNFLRIFKGDLISSDNIDFGDYDQIFIFKKDSYNENDSKIINAMIYNYNNNDILNEILFYVSNSLNIFYIFKDEIEGNYKKKINLKNCYKEKFYFISKYKNENNLDNYLIYFDAFYGEGNVYHQNNFPSNFNINFSDIFFNENIKNINSKFIEENKLDIIGINCSTSLMGYLYFYNKAKDTEILKPGKSKVYYLKNESESFIIETSEINLNFNIILLGINEQNLIYINGDFEKELTNENHIYRNNTNNSNFINITCDTGNCLFQINIENNNKDEIELIKSDLSFSDTNKKFYVLFENKTIKDNENNIGFNVQIEDEKGSEYCVSETYGVEDYISEDSNIQCFTIDNNNNNILLNFLSPFSRYQSENFQQKNFMENDNYFFILYKTNGNIKSINFNQIHSKEWKIVNNDTIINNNNNLIQLNNSNTEFIKLFVQISKCNSHNINFNLYENDYFIEENTLINNDNYIIYYNQKMNSQFEFNENDEILFRFNLFNSIEDSLDFKFTDDLSILLDGKKLKFFRMLKNENSSYEIVVTKEKNKKYLNSLCEIYKLYNNDEEKDNWVILNYEDQNDTEFIIYELDEEKIKNIGSNLAIAVIGVQKDNYKIKKLYNNIVYFEDNNSFLSSLMIFFIIVVIILSILIGFFIYKKYRLKRIDKKDILNEFKAI